MAISGNCSNFRVGDYLSSGRSASSASFEEWNLYYQGSAVIISFSAFFDLRIFWFGRSTRMGSLAVRFSTDCLVFGEEVGGVMVSVGNGYLSYGELELVLLTLCCGVGC